MALTRSPMKRAVIRSLRPGDPIPEGEPRRYRSGAGYVRLRWKVAPQTYVEVYEHRLIAGLPAGEVHHLDHSKDNNDPTNLEVLTKVEHAERHGAEISEKARRWTEWDGARSKSAFEKRQRRLARVADRQRFLAEVAALYTAGHTTIEVGIRTGRSSSNISRVLRAAGIAPAARAKSARGEVSVKVRSIVQARAGMRCEICAANLVWCGGQIHHRVPRGMGGSRVPARHEPQNLLFVCAECHRRTESRRAEALENGWLVLSRTDPATVAVLITRDRWCYLTADGRYSLHPPMEAA